MSQWLRVGSAGFAMVQVFGAGLAFAAAPGASQEVIVTALRRAQKLQDVPAKVSVVDAKTLDQAGAGNFVDIGKVAPSIVIRPDVQPVNATVSMRGAGTFAVSNSVEPSVAVLIDEVPLAFQARAFVDMSDVGSIEIVEGPQSVLYGKSASAGVINIKTASVSDVFSAFGAASTTSDGERRAFVGLSGPIGEHFGFRVSTTSNEFDGNVTNRYSGATINGRDYRDARVKAQWMPTSRFSVTAYADLFRGGTTTGRPFIQADPTALLRGTAAYPISVWLPGLSARRDSLEVTNNFLMATTYSGNTEYVRANISFGGFELVSITSAQTFKLNRQADGEETPVAALDQRSGGPFWVDQKTQEFRLNSPSTGRLRYMIGLYGAKNEISNDFTRGPFFSLSSWKASSGSKQVSAFARAEFDVTKGLNVALGGRTGREEIEYTFLDRLAGNAFFAGSDSDTYQTYDFSAKYRFTPEVMAFAKVATGHKGQTYDLSSGFNKTRAAGGPTKSEESVDYEAGMRTRLFDGRLTVNPTVFNTVYTDFQAQGLEFLVDGTINYRLTNVGSVRTRGIAVDAAFDITSALKGTLSAQYLEAQLRSFPGAQCYPRQTVAQGCVGAPARQDLSGATMPNAPRIKVVGGLDWRRPVSADLEWGVDLSGVYQSKTHFDLNNNPNTVQDGYGIVNLSTSLASKAAGWEVRGMVNNLFDEHYFASVADSSGNFGNKLVLQSIIPRDYNRYYGVQLKYRR